MLGHIDSKGFAVGMGWAIKQIRLHDGDVEAPRAVSKAARDEGTRLHDAIHAYITSRYMGTATFLESTVDEAYDLFVLWLNKIGNHNTWVASEEFLYHPEYRYGGTADAVSDSAIFDWKTKDPDSYAKYGGSLSDVAQLGAYAMALHAMGSTLARDIGYICYIMRDGSGVDTVEVDLNVGWELFRASHHLDTLVKEASHGR